METILSIIAIALSVVSMGLTLYTFWWTARRDRKQATLDAFNRLQKQALDHLNYYKPSEIAEIAKNPRSEEYKKISAYVARIEHFCVGVTQKIYDWETVYALANDYLDGSIKLRIEHIILQKNKMGGNDYYEHIHAVYDWLATRKAKKKKKTK